MMRAVFDRAVSAIATVAAALGWKKRAPSVTARKKIRGTVVRFDRPIRPTRRYRLGVRRPGHAAKVVALRRRRNKIARKSRAINRRLAA